MKSPTKCSTFVLCVCLGILSLESQTQALTCVDCTDVKIGIVGVDAIPGIRSKNCPTATLESNITKTVCPANPNGGRDEVYKCGKTSGKLSVHIRFTRNIVSGQFVDRKCVLKKKTAPDGCKEETTISKLVGVVGKVIKIISRVGSISYNGSRCTSGPLTASSGTKPTPLTASSSTKPTPITASSSTKPTALMASSSTKPTALMASSSTKPTSSDFKLTGTFSFLLLLSHFMK